MFILTTKKGGVYSVPDKEKKKIVQCFEERDDAERYRSLLEADDYKPELHLQEIDHDLVALQCGNYGYSYTIITPDVFVIPPPTIKE